MNPTKSPVNNPPTTNNAKGFSVGLFLGVLGGMATYYMFNSDEGKKLKDKLIEEYNQVAVDLPDKISQLAQSAEDKLDHLVQEAPVSTTEAAAVTTQTITQTKSLLHRLSEKVASMSSSDSFPKDSSATHTQPTPRKHTPSKRFFKQSGHKLS